MTDATTASVAAQANPLESFDLLHPALQRWVHQQGWRSLRPVQSQAITTLAPPPSPSRESHLTTPGDVILSAPTAGGKTEAALLPALSNLAFAPPTQPGFSLLYVSPMRALINDQAPRLESLCAAIDMPFVAWHGETSAARKRERRQKPEGVVLITPESLEALLMNHGGKAPFLFGALRTVIIDEMHSFMDTVRGKQLQSLLHRVDMAQCQAHGAHGHATPFAPAQRIGLSATLGSPEQGQAFLRPTQPAQVALLEGGSGPVRLALQLRGFERAQGQRDHPEHALNAIAGNAMGSPQGPGSLMADLFETHRHGHNLIFASSRGEVEETTVKLHELATAQNVPDPFMAHHGSLARSWREEAERHMKTATQPASLVCTTTLELGVDIGALDAVAQLGPGHRVASMR
ncbi:DEAD/DEAH box helicase [Formicincola oecophyllae]|uniref:DEAD/DEAH box helicase n=1 Tax=Formicincola oecophyllae TaxID=2558361 RepID=A0A4Y6U8C9_9PROT|nr:DEAD/DEAH box helicase [Formicincola oecophyllae]QDH13230.1 DEAD/DEAH box helicase [Formicincola oecophyllae]